MTLDVDPEVAALVMAILRPSICSVRRLSREPVPYNSKRCSDRIGGGRFRCPGLFADATDSLRQVPIRKRNLTLSVSRVSARRILPLACGANDAQV